MTERPNSWPGEYEKTWGREPRAAPYLTSPPRASFLRKRCAAKMCQIEFDGCGKKLSLLSFAASTIEVLVYCAGVNTKVSREISGDRDEEFTNDGLDEECHRESHTGKFLTFEVVMSAGRVSLTGYD